MCLVPCYIQSFRMFLLWAHNRYFPLCTQFIKYIYSLIQEQTAFILSRLSLHIVNEMFYYLIHPMLRRFVNFSTEHYLPYEECPGGAVMSCPICLCLTIQPGFSSSVIWTLKLHGLFYKKKNYLPDRVDQSSMHVCFSRSVSLGMRVGLFLKDKYLQLPV